MLKSINYYNNITEQFLKESKESDKRFSKAVINENISSKIKYDIGGKVEKAEFDIFLSHSYLDKKTIFGIYKDFEKMGYSTYVDWIIDPTLDRENITKRTALVLKKRMEQSKCLLYATSDSITDSIWMPWELGYMDGKKEGKVAIFPLSAEDEDDDIELPEYLELYYTCTKEPTVKTKKEVLWINESKKVYVKFKDWLNENTMPFKHP